MVNILIVHIKSTLNNTIFTITKLDGNTLFWISAGTLGFKGTRRSSALAAENAGNTVGISLSKYDCSSIYVQLNGIGAGRISSIKGLKKSGINILSIQDNTPIPHNGCRPSKKRRL